MGSNPTQSIMQKHHIYVILVLAALLWVFLFLMATKAYGKTADDYKSAVVKPNHPVLSMQEESEVNVALFYYILRRQEGLMTAAMEKDLDYLNERAYRLDRKLCETKAKAAVKLFDFRVTLPPFFPIVPKD